MTCKFKDQEVSYKLIINNVAGIDVINTFGGNDPVDEWLLEVLRNSNFYSIEMDMIEEHHRYGIQTGPLVKMEGTYEEKAYRMNIDYSTEVVDIQGDLTEDQKKSLKVLIWGEQTMNLLKAFDDIYRKQHPETPELHRCTLRLPH